MFKKAILQMQLLFVAGVLAIVLFGPDFWLLDLLTFFWAYLLLPAGVLLAAALIVREWLSLVLGIAGVALVAYPILVVPAAPDPSETSNLRVVAANIFIENPDPAGLLAFVRQVRPDILVMEETRDEWQRLVRQAGLFAYESSTDLRSRSDMKVFTRYPIVSDISVADPLMPAELERHPMRLELNVNGKPLVFYAVHPDTPRSLPEWHMRNAYLQLLARAVVKDKDAQGVILAGDWNVSLWSGHFRKVFDATGLHLAESRLPWPTRFSIRLGVSQFGSPIDHVAVSPSIRLKEVRVGAPYGSNHLPVIADLQLP